MRTLAGHTDTVNPQTGLIAILVGGRIGPNRGDAVVFGKGHPAAAVLEPRPGVGLRHGPVRGRMRAWSDLRPDSRGMAMSRSRTQAFGDGPLNLPRLRPSW